ncbi:hypothetical protein [Pseudoxanthomonas wuyuanensis]|uniref:hypothetical protein n=1 Tax=Pseudoxanthomonas wuyuanensis TaxID=1073196 RepID=UPI000BE28B8A|nr:hypothetical protein [Pseudoxanthomonas wuyuanensis]KAF1718813.1 hypothetical protein CSC75_18095 [Pseudoxanthomonas wuyuanensis]
MDTGEIIVAHRGTEPDQGLGQILRDGALTDGAMVAARFNPQTADAIALTKRALDYAEQQGRKPGGQVPEVTVTGHSLGGTHAQITAHQFGLRGETFNAYGAASLGYRIPSGGDHVINHVKAGDFVSAASPHFGQVRVYASADEIATLHAAGYANDRNPLDPRAPAATRWTRARRPWPRACLPAPTACTTSSTPTARASPTVPSWPTRPRAN